MAGEGPGGDGVLMTPFMSAVAEVVGGTGHAGLPATVPSEPRPMGVGAERQVAIRSLAEQLASEANAVLAARGERVELEDRPGDGVLVFTLRYRSRQAEVSTRFADGIAYGRLRGVAVGAQDEPARELAGPEALEDLILRLLAGHDEAPAAGS